MSKSLPTLNESGCDYQRSAARAAAKMTLRATAGPVTEAPLTDTVDAVGEPVALVELPAAVDEVFAVVPAGKVVVELCEV